MYLNSKSLDYALQTPTILVYENMKIYKNKPQGRLTVVCVHKH